MFNFSTSIYAFLIAGAYLLSWYSAPGFDGKLNSQSTVNPETLLSKSNTGFVENRGQITDQNNHANPAVKYLLLYGGLNVQLRASGFSYDSYVDETTKNLTGFPQPDRFKNDKFRQAKNITRRFHRVDIELVGANQNPEITPNRETGGVNNYYINGNEITGVRSFEKVLYSDIYPNIDLEFFLTETGQPEYQFIVRPGGNPNAIRLRYNGANSTKLVNGKIELAVAHGTIKEHIPLSYLAGSRQEVSVTYKQTGVNEYGCITPRYASNETLVIDPTPSLTWGTYYGGGGGDESYGIALDASGNLFTTGVSSSTAAIATAGAHQATMGGSTDGFIAMFSSSGVRQWGTYYGGSGFDYGYGITVDGSGNVFITGYTRSTTAIATAGAHQTTIGGGDDAFIVKFSSSGERQWGTYYGGSDNERGYGIALDASGSVCITGSTSSSTAIATAGAHQQTLGGSNDAFIVKFSSSGERQWGTYYGGNSGDTGYEIAVDASGSICITGSTSSTTAISTSGVHQTTLGGGSNDAFIAKFSSSGARQWGTYYGGSGVDIGYGIAMDGIGNVFITGYTVSTTVIATTGAHQTAYGGGSNDAFVAMFSSSGVRQWGTYYGGGGNDESWGIAVDESGYVLAAGFTTSATAIATTGAHQTALGGGTDGFIAKFSSSGARQWGTYYGGSTGSDYGYGIAADGTGNVFVTGKTNSNNAIATAGAHQTTKGSGDDTFIAKFFSPNPTTVPLRVRALLQGIWDEAAQLQTMTTPITIELRAGGTDTTDNVTPLNWTLTGTTLAGKAAGFCDANGFVDVSIPNIMPDNYWLVVRHGGHLAVASRRRIAIGSTLTEYDFSSSGFQALTKSSSVAAANGATTQGADGKWVLRAGDIIQAAPSGVNANDYAPVTGNNGRTSLVPSP